MKIGELARLTECPVETIRYYEREGLLPEPARSEGNYRLYTQAHVERLAFIRHCRSLDMTQQEIRELLRLRDNPEADCAAANRLIDEHIHHVEVRIAELRALQGPAAGPARTVPGRRQQRVVRHPAGAGAAGTAQRGVRSLRRGGAPACAGCARAALSEDRCMKKPAIRRASSWARRPQRARGATGPGPLAMVTSTRRFSAREEGESLLATG